MLLILLLYRFDHLLVAMYFIYNGAIHTLAIMLKQASVATNGASQVEYCYTLRLSIKTIISASSFCLEFEKSKPSKT
jgi:hypothetical protein